MTYYTIPTGTESRISIPARTEKPQRKPGGDVERIGVSVPEAAAMAGVSVCRMLPYVKNGTIRTVRFGKRVVVSVKSLRAYIDGTDTKEPCDSERSRTVGLGK